MGRKIKWSQRADLSPAIQTFVSNQPDNRARELVDDLVAGHDVAAVAVGQVVAVDLDTADDHRSSYRRFFATKRRLAGRSAILRIRYGYQSGPNGVAIRTL